MTLPQNIDSKFRFILVAAKRARQLQSGARAQVQSNSKKLTRVAQQEVEAGLVPFEMFEKPGASEETGKPAKASK